MGRGFGVVEDVGRVEDEPERRDGAGGVEAAREVDATPGGAMGRPTRRGR